MLGFAAASAHVIVAFEIMRLRKNERRPAGRTAYKAAQPVLQLARGPRLTRPAFLYRLDSFLCGVPCAAVDKRLVSGVADNRVRVGEVAPGLARRRPAYFPDVHRVPQDVLHCPLFKRAPPVRPRPDGVHLTGDGVHSLARDELLKHLPHQYGLPGLRRHDARSVPDFQPVAERRRGLPYAPLCVERHGALDFPRKPDGVVFVHPFQNALDQPAERPLYQRLRYADDFDIVLSEHGLVDDALLLIPRETRELPDQNAVKGVPGLFRGGNHAPERRTLRRCPAGNPLVYVDMLLRDGTAVGRRILPDDR